MILFFCRRARMIGENTRMIWIETPSNPMMNVIDIKKITDFSIQNKLLTVVDTRFPPYPRMRKTQSSVRF